MRRVAPLLAVKAHADIAGIDRAIRIVLLGPHALLARPRLEQRTIDGEMLAREQARLFRRRHGPREELRRNVAVEQPLPILRERRRVPRRGLQIEADEPAIEQIVLELLHELPLAPIEKSSCSSSARNSCSGGIDGRPVWL